MPAWKAWDKTTDCYTFLHLCEIVTFLDTCMEMSDEENGEFDCVHLVTCAILL